MSVKYIVNAKGKATEVVVPIHQWEKLTKKKNGSRMSKNTLASFAGKIKLTVDPLKFQKAIRNEW
jgi:hypothetical protein